MSLILVQLSLIESLNPPPCLPLETKLSKMPRSICRKLVWLRSPTPYDDSQIHQSQFLFYWTTTCKETVVTPRHVVVKHPGAEPQRLGIEVRLTRAFVLREHQRLACCPLPPKVLGGFKNFDQSKSPSHNVPTFEGQRGCCRDAEDVVPTSWGSSRLRSPPSTLP